MSTTGIIKRRCHDCGTIATILPEDTLKKYIFVCDCGAVFIEKGFENIANLVRRLTMAKTISEQEGYRELIRTAFACKLNEFVQHINY